MKKLSWHAATPEKKKTCHSPTWQLKFQNDWKKFRELFSLVPKPIVTNGPFVLIPGMHLKWQSRTENSSLPTGAARLRLKPKLKRRPTRPFVVCHLKHRKKRVCAS